MSYIFPVHQLTTGKSLDELPLTLDGNFTKFLKNFGTASMTLDVKDASCPPEWGRYVEPRFARFLIVDEADDRIVWDGCVSENTVNGDDTVSLELNTFEGVADTILVGDYRKIGVDQSVIFSDLVDMLIDAGYPIEKHIEPTGTQAACIIAQADNKSVLAAMQEQSSGFISYEFKFVAEWANEEHTEIKTVAYCAKTLGNDPATTAFFFEQLAGEPGEGNNGNVSSHSIKTSTANGALSTHVWGTGEGSGSKQLRYGPVINADRLADGFGRSDFAAHFQGITRKEDIEQATKALAKNLARGTTALSLTVVDSVHTPIRQIEVGDHVYVDISTRTITGAVLKRVASISQGNEMELEPLMIDPDVDPIFVPRPDDPEGLGRLIKAIKEDATAPSNPVVNGFEIDMEDGSQFVVDTEAGTVGFQDADGNLISGFDSAGNGFGGLGGGSGASGHNLGEIVSVEPNGLSVVQLDTDASAVCHNWWDSDKRLYPGDRVTVFTRTPVPAKNIAAEQGILSVYEKGPATRDALPLSSAFIDNDDTVGYGEGKVFHFGSGNLNQVYDPEADDWQTRAVTDQGIGKDDLHIFESYVFSVVRQGAPKVYLLDKETKALEPVATGLQLTDDEIASVRYNDNYEPYSRFLFTTARWTGNSSNDGSAYRHELEVTFRTLGLNGFYTSRTVLLFGGEVYDPAPPAGPPSYWFAASANGTHAYVQVGLNGFDRRSSLSYVNVSTGSVKTLVASGQYSVSEWAGRSVIDNGFPTARVSDEGKLYGSIYVSSEFVPNAKVFWRGPNDGSATIRTVSSTASEAHGGYRIRDVMRDGFTDRYVMTASVGTVVNGINTGHRGALLLLDGYQVQTLVPPLEVNLDNQYDAVVFDLARSPDGSIATVFETGSRPEQSTERSGTKNLYQVQGNGVSTLTKWKHA